MVAHFFTSCEDKLTYQGVDNINVEDKKEMLISVFLKTMVKSYI